MKKQLLIILLAIAGMPMIAMDCDGNGNNSSKGLSLDEQLLLNEQLLEATMTNKNSSNIGRITELLRMGADINAVMSAEQSKEINILSYSEGWTPLIIAADRGGFELVQLLISCKANVHATDVLGKTALMHAFEWGKMASELPRIQVLIEAGANVNEADYAGETPLHHACRKTSSVAVIQYLLDHGADVNAAGDKGGAPLHHACIMASSVAVIQCLLDHGADVNATDDIGMTPLHWACATSAVAVIQYLLDRGANINAVTCELSGKCTPLDMATHGPDAIVTHRSDVIELLLRYEAKQSDMKPERTASGKKAASDARMATFMAYTDALSAREKAKELARLEERERREVAEAEQANRRVQQAEARSVELQAQHAEAEARRAAAAHVRGQQAERARQEAEQANQRAQPAAARLAELRAQHAEAGARHAEAHERAQQAKLVWQEAEQVNRKVRQAERARQATERARQDVVRAHERAQQSERAKQEAERVVAHEKAEQAAADRLAERQAQHAARDREAQLAELRAQLAADRIAERQAERVAAHERAQQAERARQEAEQANQRVPRTWFAILGVSPNATFYEILRLPNFASIAEAKKAYRKLIKRYHSDKNPEGLSKGEGDQVVLKIYAARDTLCDEQSRKAYDKNLRQRGL